MTKIDKITDLLTRGVDTIIKKEDLEKKLRSGKKLRVKLGIDPTSPNIHIGRAVVLWKLRAFQELGHKVVFICGDFTGLVGDTSDKNAERPMLSEQQISNNMKSYFSQAAKIIDKSKAEMHYNSKWLKKLGFIELAKMADSFGLHDIASRENIAKRMQAGKRVSLRELLYPLMQGYDSVAVKADVELGGTDQTYNLLAGRTIQPLYGQAPQNILTTVLMEGLDGRKMSSSWGNVINITDSPGDMFGKVMSISDDLIEKYFLLATRTPIAEIKEVIQTNKNPRDQKVVLAKTIVTLYHSALDAKQAEQGFINQFSNKQVPDKIAEVVVKSGLTKLSQVLVDTRLASSKSEARRLLEQGGVRVNGVAALKDESIKIEKKNNLLVQVGKRKFIKIK